MPGARASTRLPAAGSLQSLKVDHVDAFRKALTTGYPPPIRDAIAKRHGGDRLAKARAAQTRIECLH